MSEPRGLARLFGRRKRALRELETRLTGELYALQLHAELILADEAAKHSNALAALERLLLKELERSVLGERIDELERRFDAAVFVLNSRLGIEVEPRT